jgi:hypothetical protein
MGMAVLINRQTARVKAREPWTRADSGRGETARIEGKNSLAPSLAAGFGALLGFTLVGVSANNFLLLSI